jgi:DNA replicative helicase MCM subunit Mcm2 (Cdc46/Mcm family)
MGNFITDYEGDENDPIPSWLFVCPNCKLKFEIPAKGYEVATPVVPCPNCETMVKGGF